MCLKFLFNVKKSNRIISLQTRNNVERDWVRVTELLDKKGPSQLREALITADRCLDSVLKDLIDGETMGERLKNSSNMFDRDLYNKIWEAHKVRNTLVHEAGYEPPYFVINQSVENLKQGLNSLGMSL
jgi:hypothetical protein